MQYFWRGRRALQKSAMTNWDRSSTRDSWEPPPIQAPRHLHLVRWVGYIWLVTWQVHKVDKTPSLNNHALDKPNQWPLTIFFQTLVETEPVAPKPNIMGVDMSGCFFFFSFFFVCLFVCLRPVSGLPASSLKQVYGRSQCRHVRAK